MSTTAISITTQLPVVQAPITPDEANRIVITDQESLELAALYIKELKAVVREIEAKRTDMKAPVLEAGRRIDANASEAKAPLLRALAILEPRYTGYVEEQRRIEREEQRRLEAEARKAAEEEQLAAAEAAQKAGASEVEVDAILTEEPVQAPMPLAPPRVQRVAGVSTTTTYSAACIDKTAFIQWAIRTPYQEDLLDVNGPALNRLATRMRDKFSIPGCKLVKKTGVRTRG